MMEKNITRDLLSLIRETGAFIKKECEDLSSGQIQKKGLNDFVTNVDREAEMKLTSKLKKILPEASFLAEEDVFTEGSEVSSFKKNKGFQWIIDPLDGTLNFIQGLPVFSVSVALRRDQEIVLGAVYEVNHNEMFFAEKGGGAFLNEKKITVSDKPELKMAVLATGFPFEEFSRHDEFMASLKFLMKHCRGLRRFGSAAVDLAYLACGRFDGFWEYNLKPWDVAAGSLIVSEAGGRISDFKGENDYLFGKEIMGANPNIYPELLSVVQNYFRND